MLERLFGDIWQLYLLAGWCSALTTAIGLIVRYIYRRAERFPARMMTAIIEGWKEHEEASRSHVSELNANTQDIGWMKGALRTHGDLGRRLDTLEIQVTDISNRLGRSIQENT